MQITLHKCQTPYSKQQLSPSLQSIITDQMLSTGTWRKRGKWLSNAHMEKKQPLTVSDKLLRVYTGAVATGHITTAPQWIRSRISLREKKSRHVHLRPLKAPLPKLPWRYRIEAPPDKRSLGPNLMAFQLVQLLRRAHAYDRQSDKLTTNILLTTKILLSNRYYSVRLFSLWQTL